MDHESPMGPLHFIPVLFHEGVNRSLSRSCGTSREDPSCPGANKYRPKPRAPRRVKIKLDKLGARNPPHRLKGRSRTMDANASISSLIKWVG